MTYEKTGGSRDWSPERLELPPESLRAFGYRIVDMLVDHQEGLANKPVTAL